MYLVTEFKGFARKKMMVAITVGDVATKVIAIGDAAPRFQANKGATGFGRGP